MSECEVKHCKQQGIALIYYNHPICEKHWLEHCHGKRNLKVDFNINDEVKKDASNPM
jgi:hypothetical protein